MMTCTLKTAAKRLVRTMQIGTLLGLPALAHAQSNAEFLQQLNNQISKAAAAYRDGMRIGAEGLARQNAEFEQLERRAAQGDQAAAAEYDRRTEALNRHRIAVMSAAAAESEAQTRRTQDYYRRQWQRDYHTYVQGRDWALQEGRKAASRGDLDRAARYASEADYYGQKASEYRPSSIEAFPAYSHKWARISQGCHGRREVFVPPHGGRERRYDPGRRSPSLPQI